MLRRTLPAECFHVTMRGIGRRAIFEDDADRKRFLAILKAKLADSDASVLAWCLMDNHVHLLLRTGAADLSRLMQRLGTAYAQYYNGRHGHVGKVFQNRFGSQPVEDEAHLAAAIRYIHENPRDRGEFQPGEYPWSSFREIAGSATSDCAQGIADADSVLDLFGGLEGFLRFHATSNAESELVWINGYRPRIDDAEAADIAARMFGELFADRICAMPKGERNAALASLKQAGLSIRQIERLTGIGRGTIARA